MARSAAGAREKFKVFKFFQRVIVSGKGSCSVGIRNSTRSRERETKRRICEAWGQWEKGRIFLKFSGGPFPEGNHDVVLEKREIGRVWAGRPNM